MANASLYSKYLKDNFHIHLIIPELAEELGLDESIVLQRIHYWITKSGKLINQEQWIYNTFDDWSKQFKYWSISKIKRIFYSLEGKGFIRSKKMNANKSNHTKWYTIDYDKLICLIECLVPEKKFAEFKNELSLCQSDTIINSNTYNNSTNINNLSNEINKLKEPSELKKARGYRKTEISKDERDISEKMVQTWCNVFINQEDRVLLTPKRIKSLYHAYVNSFEEDLEQWKQFCILINSSKFLMGEKKSGFKARFDWLISEEVIKRILAKEFDIGDRIPDIEAVANNQKLEIMKQQYAMKKASLEEQRARDEEVRRLENVAEKLAWKELEEAEANWDECDKMKVRSAFEDYMSQEVIEDDLLARFKPTFSNTKWASNMINTFFEHFKIKFCLKKSLDDYMAEARLVLNAC